MKVLKKVLTAIGHFFRNIWRYIMTNAWIQPILIVALIFAIIFGLTGIPTLIDKIEELFDDSVDNKIKNQKKIDYDDFIEMYNNDETFFVIFGSDECSACKTLYKDINTYMKDSSHKEIVNAPIYFMNITDLLEDVDDDVEKYGKYDFEVKGDNFNNLLTLSNILYNGYSDIYDDGTEYTTETQTYGNDSTVYAIQTPTTAFFTKGELFNIVKGQWKYNQGYSDIKELFECWHASSEDWASAVTRRDAVNNKHQG